MDRAKIKLGQVYNVNIGAYSHPIVHPVQIQKESIITGAYEGLDLKTSCRVTISHAKRIREVHPEPVIVERAIRHFNFLAYRQLTGKNPEIKPTRKWNVRSKESSDSVAG